LIILISVSSVARITDVSHQCPASEEGSDLLALEKFEED
jgi:hypothetical protein